MKPEKDWEERAAIMEYDGGLPRDWAEPFAKILCGDPPADYSDAYWHRIIDGAMLFADKWASKARELGWTAEEVFGLHPTAACSRDDCKGFAWMLRDGAQVTDINERFADITTKNGTKQRYYR